MDLRRFVLVLLACLSCLLTASAQEKVPFGRIPKISRPPKFEDFLNNTPREAELKVAEFRQIDPGDGDPASQPTTAYLSYDDKNLYAAFICIDDPKKIRAQITRRDALYSDDRVNVSIDTFHDHRRNYAFDVNPYGVQMDSINTEGMDDFNFDTLWYSQGKITKTGYTVLITIPFKSLRFRNAPRQSWGILLNRVIQRNNEYVNWPYATWRLMPSWAGQFAHLEGIENISPGRNLQLIPYILFSRSRNLNSMAPGWNYGTDNEVQGGLDAKMILRDSLTLDMTVNPDFSQVESDSPQVTVNQRYEVFFPEKRPFFIENSDYFKTPENLFFSRRMMDPQVGARLTGKLGRWGIGVLAGDDQAPGQTLPSEDRYHDNRAGIGVFRLYRELGTESRVGMMVTSRDFGSSSNRVFSMDTRLKLGKNLVFSGQWIGSKTRELDGSHHDGAAAFVKISQSGRNFTASGYYQDRSAGFDTKLGFIERTDIRENGYDLGYTWHPEKSSIVSYGPNLGTSITWDHKGTLTDWEVKPSFTLNLLRNTRISFSRTESFERFEGIDFRKSRTGASFGSECLRWLYLSGDIEAGDRINYFPAAGLDPFNAKSLEASLGVTLQPGVRIRLDETYLYTNLSASEGSASIFNNHILRSKINYQFNKEFSLRAIVDYNAILPNSSLVFLERTKQLGLDFLFTYMPHPGTALHVGYTDIYENLRLDSRISPYVQRNGFPDASVGRQFFVKLSYLFRM